MTPTPHAAPRRAHARRRRYLQTALLLLLPLAALGTVLFLPVRPAEAGASGGDKSSSEAQADDRSAAAEAYGKLPLQFEVNRGQTDERVRFISRGDGYVMFLTADEAVLALNRGGVEKGEQAGSYSVLRMRLLGASGSPQVEGRGELPGQVNYFVGSDAAEWRTRVPVYGRVHYGGIYPGIDLVYYGNQRQLEYDFRVAPGADPHVIKLRFEGAERATVDERDGSLSLHVGDGEVRMKRPVIYQVGENGDRQEVAGGYTVKGREVEFNVGRYDAGRPLVIDPVISYSTFIGIVSNLSATAGASLALDSSGSAYVTGAAGSLAFPAPGVKLVPAGSFSSNVFVTKLNAAGTSLVYTSYLGGFSDEVGLGIALDSSGDAYVTGRTNSSDFPTTANALRTNDDLLKSGDGGATWQLSNAGLQNRPVTRLWADPSAASTLYALTFNGIYKTTGGGARWSLLNTGLNSSGSTSASALAVAPSNPAILYAGNQGPSARVIKSTDGGASWTQANTGLPGLNVSGLAVDPTNPDVVFAGTYFDVYKTTDGGAHWNKAGTGINFGSVTSFLFDPTNTSVVYALAGGNPIFKTTNGGASWSQATSGISPANINAVVLDPTSPSTLYAATGTGLYKSTNGAVSWTPVNNGLTNLSVRSLASDPAAPSTLYAGTTKGGVYKTTDGGAHWTQVHSGMGGATVLSLAVSASSQVYAGIDTTVSGSTQDSEAFVSKLSPAGDSLVYSTYLGGTGNEEGDAIAVDAAGDAYVAGQTSSADFPLAGPRVSSLKGASDAFVTKLNPAGTSLLFSTLVGGVQGEIAHSVALDAAGNAYACGETTSPDFPATPGAFSTTFIGQPFFPTGNDGFVFKIDAAGSALAYATFLGGDGDDRASDIAVDASGNAYVTGSTSSTNFPVLNAVQPTLRSSRDAYATKLNASGSALVYSTYLGSGAAQSIALDAAGAAYLTGTTSSTSFPVTPDTLKFNSPLYRTTNSGVSWSNDNFGLSAGSLSGNPGSIHDLVADPATPFVLYATSDDGVYKSTDGGRKWARASNGLTPQRINTIAIDPKTPSTLYAGASVFNFNTPALYKSTDGGANWSPLASSSSFQSVNSIAVDPRTPANLYVTNGNTIFKSTDGGASWSALGNNAPGSASSLTIDPSSPSTIYAAANNGIYKTTDGGANWTLLGGGLPTPVGAGRVAIDVARPSTLYANTSGGIYKTTDGGASWTLSLKGTSLSRLIVVDPSDTSTVYAYVGQASGTFSVNFFLYRTSDGGANWVVLHNAPPNALTALAIDPFTRTNLYLAIDTFSFSDADAFVLKLAPAGDSIVYATLLGGRVATPGSSTPNISDQGTAVAVDEQGAAYVAGVSFTSDFPTTLNSFLPYNRSGADIFVTKLVTAPAIGGVVRNGSGVPQQGVKLTLTGATSATQFTGADGTYLFPNLVAGGAYTVSAAKSGVSFTPPSQSFTNLNTDQSADFTLGASVATHRIAGRLADSSGAPVAGATVALSGSQIELTTSDAAGNYAFNAPDGGSYTVTPSAVGFLFNPASASVNSLAADQTLNFTAARQDFVVTNTNDAGAGSLRQAVTDANVTPGPDRITFNIPGAGVHTITLNTPLPEVVEPVAIDGSTQPGYAGAPLVELSGANIAAPTTPAGLVITAGDSLVRGLVINRFGGSGVVLSGGGNNRLEGNIIGLDPTGTAKRSNKGNGISVQGSSANVIGGTSLAQRNLISGNEGNGIFISGLGNQVKGNYIGTDASGTQTFSNLGSGNGWGVIINLSGQSTDGNIIGGTEPGARNLISGNQAGGIDASAPGTIVQGNYIGTDASGTAKLPNGLGVKVSGTNVVVGGTTAAARNLISGNVTGVQLSLLTANPSVTLKGNYIGTDPTGTSAVGNGTGINSTGQALIGGTEPGAGNLVSGNGVGIQLTCCGPGSTVKGNLIGADATATRPLGNGTGIDIESSQNVIGGTEPGARNLISGNGVGISLGGLISPGPSRNAIRNNFIGLNGSVANAGPLPNTSYGIYVRDASDTAIGGDATDEGNIIAFNGEAGIAVGATSFNNTVKGNRIYSNGKLGIDLFDSTTAQSVTRNDAGDADEGGNHLQNFPVVTSFADVAGGLNVKGTLNSKPGTQYRIDFYNSFGCDASGFGEGAQPLGSTQVTTDAAGNASFDVTLPGQSARANSVTATATDPAGNTSEFSSCDASAATGSVEFVSADFRVLEDVGAAVVRVVRTGGSRGTTEVAYTTGDGTATPGVDYTPVSGQLTFADGETSKTILIPIANDGVTEPEETVRLSLAGAALPAFGPKAQATLHIFDSDTPVTISVENTDAQGVSLTEGDAGTRNGVVVARLSAATGRTITVDYDTIGGTASGLATPGADFLPVNGTLTFGPGVERGEINIPIVGDTIDEFDEFFTLELKNPTGATVATPQTAVTILDDDAPPQVSVTDVTVAEGAGAKAVFAVRLSQPSGKGASVAVSTADGTANAGSDYTPVNAALNFNPGQTVRFVEVPVLADNLTEPDETFFLNVASRNLTRATVADGQGQATIIDSGSSASLVQFGASSYTVNETDGQAQINVTRTGDASQPARVDYRTVSQSASERTDFTTSVGTLRFAAGETQKSFTVLVSDDRFVEPDESLDLVLSNPSGAALGGPSVSSLTILSDDATDGPSPVRDASFNAQFFVRQHYHDFLNREPDAAGLAFWSNEIDSCTDTPCREVKEINVSAAFFLSIEFQETGYLAYRTYKAAYGDATSPNVAGTVPVIRLREFIPDSQRISQGVQVGIGDWQAQLEANKQAYMTEFVQRPRFLDAYPLTMTPAQFVDKLNQNAGGVLSPSERDQAVANLAAVADQTQGRAAALRAVAEDADMRNKEQNRAFVLMQYFGYLRRNPDDPQDTDFRGWKFWLSKLDQFGGNFVQAEMVKAFITSDEYGKRFGQ